MADGGYFDQSANFLVGNTFSDESGAQKAFCMSMNDNRHFIRMNNEFKITMKKRPPKFPLKRLKFYITRKIKAGLTLVWKTEEGDRGSSVCYGAN